MFKNCEIWMKIDKNVAKISEKHDYNCNKDFTKQCGYTKCKIYGLIIYHLSVDFFVMYIHQKLMKIG